MALGVRLRAPALDGIRPYRPVRWPHDEVIDFYDGGGGAGRGITTPQQTLPSDSLHLSTTEKGDLIDFLRTLTDTAGTTRSP